jgi:hypothetical protein
MQRVFQRETPARQAEIFRMYCGMAQELLSKFPGRDPSAAAYFTKDSDERSGGTTLCIAPGTAGNPKPNCSIQFDVSFEDGQVKKNEL